MGREIPASARDRPQPPAGPGTPGRCSPDEDALVAGSAAPAAQHGVVGAAGHGEDVGRQRVGLEAPVPLGDLRGNGGGEA